MEQRRLWPECQAGRTSGSAIPGRETPGARALGGGSGAAAGGSSLLEAGRLPTGITGSGVPLMQPSAEDLYPLISP